MGNEQWIDSSTAVVVNGKEYVAGYVWNDNKYSLAKTDGEITIGSGSFKNGENTIIIDAEGYNRLTIVYNK